MHHETETVYDVAGNKAGVVVREGADWAAYNLSDLETYRGPMYTLACLSLWDGLTTRADMFNGE